MARQSAAIQIFRRLPDEFTRQDVLEEGKKLDYAYSTTSSATTKMLYMGIAERIYSGHYRKLKRSFEI
jgi:hypothetical protein